LDWCLLIDGRIKTSGYLNSIPKGLLKRLTVESNYVESLVASSHHFAALLRLDNGSQEVYIWGNRPEFDTAEKENFKLHPCFQKENSEDGKSDRKRIVNIVATHTDHDFFLSEGHKYLIEAFAINFEDNTSCLLSWNGWFLVSFAEHVRSIYSTVDGILIVTDSGDLKVVHDLGDFKGEWYLEELKIADIKRPVSFVVAPDGYVLLYPAGTYEISKSAQPPLDIRKRIQQAGGIAEIYHDLNGTFHAILRDGTIATWYTELAEQHENLSLSSR
jgi:hypothetical protein